MTEKDNVSMTTVQMKTDYAPSEVYSTASEPPPAYKRQANSVKIAKIVAFTVILSSVIIGSFILASAYIQARASCDQVQALDSVLEKELMLETLQQENKELPRAEALLGKGNIDIDLQNLDTEEPIAKEAQATQESAKGEEETSDTDTSFPDSEETDDLQKTQNKVPLELDLSDLAAALLQSNHKSRMNCVVERKRAEEIVDAPARTVPLPFGLNLTTEPKKAKITGERISIFCDGGEADKNEVNNKESNEDTEDDDVEALRPMFIPFQRVPIPFGATPQQFPLTHMPQRMMPAQSPMYRQLPPPFQQLPLRPPMPPQVMQAPHPEPQQIRIQLHQIPIREMHVTQDLPLQIPSSAGSSSAEMPRFQVQRVPLGLALQRAGITADDLRNIQRMAEERITDELRRLAAEEAAAASTSESESESEEEDNTSTRNTVPQMSYEAQQLPLEPQTEEQAQMMQQQPPLPPMPRDTMTPPMPDQAQIMQIGRSAFGRSMPSPVRIPVPMMQAQADMAPEADSTATADSERPHFVQPRSIRSTDSIFKEDHKRVKKCACDCSC